MPWDGQTSTSCPGTAKSVLQRAAVHARGDPVGGAGQGSARTAGGMPAEGVRWYLMFPISYRDLELMLLDRGVEVDHSTMSRWIQAYAAELGERIAPHP